MLQTAHGPAKNVVMLGGPNGAGKTTMAFRLLPKLGVREFVNADEIARGLSPLNPESSALSAGRLMIERMQMLIHVRENFAFETTCSGRSHVHLLEQCRAVGYQLTLVFLWLQSAQTAIERVGRRIREGGHRIPQDVIIRRYKAGLRNMRHIYLPLVDTALIFNNSDDSGELIAERQEGGPLLVYDAPRWNEIEEATQ